MFLLPLSQGKVTVVNTWPGGQIHYKKCFSFFIHKPTYAVCKHALCNCNKCTWANYVCSCICFWWCYSKQMTLNLRGPYIRLFAGLSGFWAASPLSGVIWCRMYSDVPFFVKVSFQRSQWQILQISKGKISHEFIISVTCNNVFWCEQNK